MQMRTQVIGYVVIGLLVASIGSIALGNSHATNGHGGITPGTEAHNMTVTFNQTGAQCATDATEVISNISASPTEEAYTATVHGTVKAANPCATLEYTTQRTDDGYVLNITTQPADGMCVQCVGSLSYDATIQFDAAGIVSIVHDGETVDTLYVREDTVSQNTTKNETSKKTGGHSSESYSVPAGRITVETQEATCRSGPSVNDVTESRVNPVDVGGYSVEVIGQIDPASACSSVVSNLTQEGNTYVLNLAAVSEDTRCVSCVGQLTYRVGARLAQDDFTLKIQHAGETKATVKPAREQQSSIWQQLVGFVRSLFGM